MQEKWNENGEGNGSLREQNQQRVGNQSENPQERLKRAKAEFDRAQEILGEALKVFAEIEVIYHKEKERLEKLQAASAQVQKNYAQAKQEVQMQAMFSETVEEVLHDVAKKERERESQKAVRKKTIQRLTRSRTAPEPVDPKRQGEIEDKRRRREERLEKLPLNHTSTYDVMERVYAKAALKQESEVDVLPTEIGETDLEENAWLIWPEDYRGSKHLGEPLEQEHEEKRRDSTCIPPAPSKNSLQRQETAEQKVVTKGKVPKPPLVKTGRMIINTKALRTGKEPHTADAKKLETWENLPALLRGKGEPSSLPRSRAGTTPPVVETPKAGEAHEPQVRQRKWVKKKEELEKLRMELEEQSKKRCEEREEVLKAQEQQEEPKKSDLCKSIIEGRYTKWSESSIDGLNLSPRGSRKTDGADDQGKKHAKKHREKKGDTGRNWKDTVERSGKPNGKTSKSDTWAAPRKPEENRKNQASQVMEELKGKLPNSLIVLSRNGHAATEEAKRNQGQSGGKGK